MVQVYTPAFQATVYKRIGFDKLNGASQRFQGQTSTIDLTPYMGDGSTITTTKDIRSPSGSWSINLVDQVDQRSGASGTADSLYGVIQPMDYVEIRGARSPETYGGPSGQNMPVIMRGFVRNVRRSQSLSNDGAPVRRLSIIGEDYGMVGQVMQIFLRADYETGNDYLTGLRLLVNQFFGDLSFTPNDFMTRCIIILNKWISALGDSGATGSIVPLIQASLSVSQGLIWIGSPATQLFEGALWHLMTQWADQPWNELFIEDQDTKIGGDIFNGPALIYRPCPFVDINGQSIFGVPIPVCSTKTTSGNPGNIVGPNPDTGNTPLLLTDDDVITYDIVRSDSAVWNYFWVPPSYANLTNPELVTLASLDAGQVIENDNPNNDPTLYGLRLISQQSAMAGTGGYVLRPLLDGQISGTQANYVDWYASRRDALKLMNHDNVVLDRGTIVVKGNENLRAGRYITINLGGVVCQFYIYGVSHNFVAFRGFVTTLTVDRGTNFLQRVKATNSAYFNEGTAGTYA